MDKHLLLISFTFPPSPGIGGRRWAKFAKYLTRLGYTIHVIYAENQSILKESNYIKDVTSNPNIKIYPFKPFYPAILNIAPKTILEKLQYNFWAKTLPFFVKGYVYDKAIFSENRIVSLAEEIIKTNQIKNVIATGAPFRINYYSTKIKDKFPEINLINDFRDPWMWGHSYSYNDLNDRDKKHELSMQQAVINKSDSITVPVHEMQKYLMEENREFASKIKLLTHAFDTDEIMKKPKKGSEKVRILFYGTLYPYLNSVIEKLALVIKKHERNIELDIFSTSEIYKEIFAGKKLLEQTVRYHSHLPPEQLFEKMDNYDYVLIIQPDYAKDYITTKIYEIIYSGTPIILIARKGNLSDFISEYKLGICFTVEDLIEKFDLLFNVELKKFSSDFPINNYSYECVTSKLVSYFK